MENILRATIGTVVAIIFLGLAGIAGGYETHYKMNCEVVKIENNICYVEDERGECYGFEQKKDSYEVGDKLKVTFFTNCTDSNIYDDEIEKVKKVVDK